MIVPLHNHQAFSFCFRFPVESKDPLGRLNILKIRRKAYVVPLIQIDLFEDIPVQGHIVLRGKAKLQAGFAQPGRLADLLIDFSAVPDAPQGPASRRIPAAFFVCLVTVH